MLLTLMGFTLQSFPLENSIAPSSDTITSYVEYRFSTYHCRQMSKWIAAPHLPKGLCDSTDTTHLRLYSVSKSVHISHQFNPLRMADTLLGCFSDRVFHKLFQCVAPTSHIFQDAANDVLHTGNAYKNFLCEISPKKHLYPDSFFALSLTACLSAFYSTAHFCAPYNLESENLSVIFFSYTCTNRSTCS
jgi:hypothetical protein